MSNNNYGLTNSNNTEELHESNLELYSEGNSPKTLAYKIAQKRLLNAAKASKKPANSNNNNNDEELQRALEMSRELAQQEAQKAIVPSAPPASPPKLPATAPPANNANNLQRAIELSLQLAQPANKTTAIMPANTAVSAKSAKPPAKSNTTRKARAPLNRQLPAFGPDDYLQFNVRGDGNCFYRSVYNAAKYHPIPGTLDRMLRCINHPENEPVTEESFNGYARQKLAYLIRHGQILEEKAAADGSPGFTLYHMLKQYAENANKKKKVERNTTLWVLTKDDASLEIQKELLNNPAKFEKISEKQFKKLLANIVSRDEVYVSEIDVTLIDFMFANCGENSVHIQRISPDDRVAPSDTWVFDVAPGEQPGPPVPNILIRREGDHYNYYMKGSVFNNNEEKKQAAISGDNVGDRIIEVFTADRTEVIARIKQKEEAAKKEREKRLANEAAKKAAKNAMALVAPKPKKEKKHDDDYGINANTSSEYTTNVVSNWAPNSNVEEPPPAYRPIPYREAQRTAAAEAAAVAAAKAAKKAAAAAAAKAAKKATAKAAAPAKPAPVSVTAKKYPATKPVTAVKPPSKPVIEVEGNAFNNLREKAIAARRATTLKANKPVNAAAQTRKAPKLAIPEEPLSNTTAENTNNEGNVEPLGGLPVTNPSVTNPLVTKLAQQLKSTPMNEKLLNPTKRGKTRSKK